LEWTDVWGNHRSIHIHNLYPVRRELVIIKRHSVWNKLIFRDIFIPGGGQNSSSGGQGKRDIAFGVLIEPVFPERVPAPTAVEATQRQHVFCAGQGPEHA
jgi:hypothetical protein